MLVGVLCFTCLNQYEPKPFGVTGNLYLVPSFILACSAALPLRSARP